MHRNYMFILYCNFVSFQVILWFFMIFVFIFIWDDNLRKMKGIGVEMSEEEDRAKLKHWSEEISHWSKRKSHSA